MAAFNTSTRLFDGLMYLVVIVAGGLSLVYGTISAGDLVAYVLYVSTLIATIRRIVEFAEQFQRGMTGIERFVEIMDAPLEINDVPDAKPLQVEKGEHPFDDVSFDYPDDHNKVLPCQPEHPAGRESGAGRAFRRRQDHPVQPDPPLLRCDRRPHPDRRAGHPA